MQGSAEQYWEDHPHQSTNLATNMLETVSWNDTCWRRMVNNFFLREIHEHRCLRSNLSRGSVSAMNMLRQEVDNSAGPTRTPAQLNDDAEIWYAENLSMQRDL